MLALWYLFSSFVKRNNPPCDEEQLLRQEIEIIQNHPTTTLKKYFQPDFVNNWGCVKTCHGFGVSDLISPFITGEDQEFGVEIPHPHCLFVFDQFFNPLISDLHGGFNKAHIHPPSNFGIITYIKNVDPSGNFIITVQIKLDRNLEGYMYPKWAQLEELEEIEENVKRGIGEVHFSMAGKYMKWNDIDDKTVKFLKNNNLLPVDFEEGFNANGRGFFITNTGNVMIWVNTDNHVKVIAHQEGGNLGVAYDDIYRVSLMLERRCIFDNDKKFGFLGSNVKVLGTGLTVSVYMNLPNHSSEDDTDQNKALANDGFELKEANLGSVGDGFSGIWRLENTKHLGTTEIETLNYCQKLVVALVQEERNRNTGNTFRRIVKPGLRNAQGEICDFPGCESDMDGKGYGYGDGGGADGRGADGRGADGRGADGRGADGGDTDGGDTDGDDAGKSGARSGKGAAYSGDDDDETDKDTTDGGSISSDGSLSPKNSDGKPFVSSKTSSLCSRSDDMTEMGTDDTEGQSGLSSGQTSDNNLDVFSNNTSDIYSAAQSADLSKMPSKSGLSGTSSKAVASSRSSSVCTTRSSSQSRADSKSRPSSQSIGKDRSVESRTKVQEVTLHSSSDDYEDSDEEGTSNKNRSTKVLQIKRRSTKRSTT